MNFAGAAGQWFKAGGRQILDAVLPPRCLICGDRLPDQGRLCGGCWGEIAFLTPPYCRHCGAGFDYPVAGERHCAACLARPPQYDQAIAALQYEGAGRRLILGFKHGDHLEYAPLLAGWMIRAGRGLLDQTDLMLPVPLHPSRLWRRRFNQSAELCKAISRQIDAPYDFDLLRRRRATISQGGLNARQRARNVRGAFALGDAAPAAIRGKRILLVDDVLTTGATVEACARLLRRAGARQVFVLTLARVARPMDTTL